MHNTVTAFKATDSRAVASAYDRSNRTISPMNSLPHFPEGMEKKTFLKTQICVRKIASAFV